MAISEVLNNVGAVLTLALMLAIMIGINATEIR